MIKPSYTLRWLELVIILHSTHSFGWLEWRSSSIRPCFKAYRLIGQAGAEPGYKMCYTTVIKYIVDAKLFI